MDIVLLVVAGDDSVKQQTIEHLDILRMLDLPAGVIAQWQMIRSDAAQHKSPNAGWPEAAMAGALGIALSGPRSYEGQMRDFPFVNPAGRRDPGPDDIDACAGMLWRAWALFFGVVTLAALVF